MSEEFFIAAQWLPTADILLEQPESERHAGNEHHRFEDGQLLARRVAGHRLSAGKLRVEGIEPLLGGAGTRG